MTIVVLEPRLQLGAVGVAACIVASLRGLWLLLGPTSTGQRESELGDDRPGASNGSPHGERTLL